MEVSVLLFLLLLAQAALAGTSYVDCARGSDTASGASPEAAWKTVAKVSAQTFAPGDAILFRRGARCSGMLWPKGSGESKRPIRIGSYGEGALPVIDGTGQEAAVKLFNQQSWEIEDIEATGGNPYGIYIGADSGRLTHFRVRDVIVHDVTGEVTKKDSGLIAVLAGGSATLEDIVIDGARAYDTTQWAGVIVRGASRENRARDVVVRNTVVHDVFGDAIILFQVENGLIEKSAAWLAGLMPRERIGTPNGIWTWRCRKCTVQLTEGFFMDSPGVDGGVYDIDWGNDDNVVQYNYGHDSQGYCASVFGASKEITTNSVIRYNVCVNNGRSPKLARLQGDMFITTWEGGSVDGVLIHNNTFYWNPPIDAPAVQITRTDFSGARPNRFFNNMIHSTVPKMVNSPERIEFDRNVYWYAGKGKPEWRGGKFVNPLLDALMRPLARSPLIDGGLRVDAGATDATGAPVQGAGPDIGAIEFRPDVQALEPQPSRWILKLSPDVSAEDARTQRVFLEAALAQYGDTRLDVEWDAPNAGGALLALVSPSGKVVREWKKFAWPADLGLTLRHLFGAPR